MKLFLAIITTLFSLSAFAQTQQLELNADADNHVFYPATINTNLANGSDQGVSLAVDVLPALANPENHVIDGEQKWFEWSYNRGVGKVPNYCAAGSSKYGAQCIEECPTGFSSALGTCWQSCPQGTTDIGALCTSLRPLHLSAKSTARPAKSPVNCAPGLSQEAGLCYEPCAEDFKGVGALCVAQLNTPAQQSRVALQIADQQLESQANGAAGGIDLPAEKAPTLRTHVVFNSITCGLDGFDGSLSDLTGISFIPTISDVVLFDFSAKAECSDDGVISTAAMSFDPSISVKIGSELLDPLAHAMSGVDLGFLKLSLYELIPFRVYGAIGSTLAAPTELLSQRDRSLPEFTVAGQPHATLTRITTDPSVDVWTSLDAYVRITSLFEFIPDFLQLGADFKLHLVDTRLPYQLEEGLRFGDAGYELYRNEQLDNELRAGNGEIKSFLKILGRDIDVFGDKASAQWEGYYHYKELVRSSSRSPLEI